MTFEHEQKSWTIKIKFMAKLINLTCNQLAETSS